MGRVCPFCGKRFAPRETTQDFCSPAHCTAFHQAMRKWPQIIMPMAVAWRSGKHGATPDSTYGLKHMAALEREGPGGVIIVERKMRAMWSAADLA